VQLPRAYRSLPRPSSPLDAKAFTVCLIWFDLTSVGRWSRSSRWGRCGRWGRKPTALTSLTSLTALTALTDCYTSFDVDSFQHHPVPQLSKSVGSYQLSANSYQLRKWRERREEEVRAIPENFRAIGCPAGYSLLQKGGDPAAGSPTATLLRLRPSH
jgi:hypothetical protein